MTKILITNAWSWFNKGDAAIVITMVQALRKYIPEAEISLISYTPEVDSLKYKNYKIEVLRGLRVSESARITKGITIFSQWIRRSLWGVLYSFLKKDIRWLKGQDREVLDKYAQNDIIVSCGGEVIWGNAGYILNNLLEIFFGKLLNKPVVIYAHSIGPFNGKLAELIARVFLNQADLITLREWISKEYLRIIKVTKPPIIVTADSAFMLHPVSPPKAKELLFKEGIDLKRMHVGMTFRRWIFPNSEYPEVKHKKYVTEMSKIVDYIIERLRAVIVFMPQVIVANSGMEDDRTVAQEIFQLLNNKNDFKMLIKDFSPEELEGIIGQMDLFIGTRMHSNIFALSMYVPTIAIGYRHKTIGIMKMLGMEKYVCDISNIKFEDVVQKVEDALVNRENIKNRLKVEMKKIRNRALYNAELVKNCLDMHKERVSRRKL